MCTFTKKRLQQQKSFEQRKEESTAQWETHTNKFPRPSQTWFDIFILKYFAVIENVSLRKSRQH